MELVKNMKIKTETLEQLLLSQRYFILALIQDGVKNDFQNGVLKSMLETNETIAKSYSIKMPTIETLYTEQSEISFLENLYKNSPDN